MMYSTKQSTIVRVSNSSPKRTISNFDGNHKKVKGTYDVLNPTDGKIIKFPYSSDEELKEMIPLIKEIKREMREAYKLKYRIVA